MTSVGQTTIFAEMTELANRTGSVNLGQGFPDDPGPSQVLLAAQRAIADGINQYPPGRGMPVLREAIAGHQQRFWGIGLDPRTEVLVTAGATEALAATLLALVRPGDEVLTLEPFYDAYAAVIALAGGRHVTVPLRLADGRFTLEADEVRAAVSDRTRVILVNNPNNPTGFQFSRDDLAVLVELAHRHDATIVTDEVYEHLCFSRPHVPVASLPGGFERTLTISSAGKTFSVTGWKIGWLTGPAALVDRVLGVKQWLTFTNGAPFQPAVAVGLRLPESAFDAVRDRLRERRDLLCAALRDAGLAPVVPQAGYFVVTDLSPLGIVDGHEGVERMAREAGVVGIPFGAFCRPSSDLGRSWVRFAHCKSAGAISQAAERLAHWGDPHVRSRPGEN